MPEYQLEGWQDLIENLQKLPARAEKNILRGMVADSAAATRDAIKERAPLLKPETLNPHNRYPGQLRDSVISVRVNPNQTPGAVAAGVKIRGSAEALQETKSAGRALGKGRLKTAATALASAMADGYYWRWIEFGSPHNRPPQPFIRPAWDGIKGSLLARMRDYASARLGKLTRD